MILLANFIFLIASLICALSVNLAMMLAGRALQGIGGGGIVVLTNISVSDLVSVRLVLLASGRLPRAMLTPLQTTTHVLWSVRCYLGYCWSFGAYYWRRFHHQCDLAMVLLFEL